MKLDGLQIEDRVYVIAGFRLLTEPASLKRDAAWVVKVLLAGFRLLTEPASLKRCLRLWPTGHSQGVSGSSQSRPH